MSEDSKQPLKAILATKHGKEVVMQPLIKDGLGIDIWVPTDFDTDQFGTFTREKNRTGNQLETARRKARAAMERYGYQVGIASEGSFGLHPQLPLLQSNLELVVLIDDVHGVEVIGQARSGKNVAKAARVWSTEEAVALADDWGFPTQGIIVRRSEKSYRHMYKDITTVPELQRVVSYLLRLPFIRSLYMETDLRAHRHTSRMETIAEATNDMIARYQVRCPACQAPGFQPVSVAVTAVCQRCNLSTDVPYMYTHRCQKCGHEAQMMNPGAVSAVTAGECLRCNP